MEHILKDIQLAYAYTLNNITAFWVQDDDGAVNYYQCGERKVTYINNNVDLIYQPCGPSGEVPDYGAVIIKAAKGSGYVITKELFEEVKPLLYEVELKYVEAVNSFVKKYDIWVKDIYPKSTFNQLLKIIKPIHFEKDCIKMKFEIGCYYNGPMTRWSGPDFMNWIYSLPAHEKMRKTEYESQKEVYQKGLLKIEEDLNDYLEQMETAFNQLHAQEINDKIERSCKVKEEFKEYLQNIEEIITKPQVFGVKDLEYPRGECDTKEFMDQFDGKSNRERENDSRSSPISFKDAFPDKIFLSLKVHKRSIETLASDEALDLEESKSFEPGSKRAKKN